jgi:integrase/recombinase XerC
MTDIIAAYEQHLIDLDRSERTVADYIGILRRMDRDLDYGLINSCTDEIKAWIFAPSRGPATRGLYCTIARGFGKWAADPEDPWLDFDATATLPRVAKPKRSPKPVKTEQLADILNRAAEPYRVWFVAAAYEGMRCVEIGGLDRRDVDEENTVIRRGKGRKERTVPTHPVFWRVVRDLPPGPIAVDHDQATRLSAQKVAHRGNHHLRSALRLPGVSMHRLRHWYGTNAYRATKDLRAVQELMGHSSPSTTQVYVEVAEEQKIAAVNGLPDVS